MKVLSSKPHGQIEEKSIHRSFGPFFGAGLSLYVLAAFVQTQYFARDTWANITSYFSNEPPWGIGDDCLPEPLGVHYFGDLVTTACHSLLKNPYEAATGTNYLPGAYWLMRPFGLLMRSGLVYALALYLLVFLLMLIAAFRLAPARQQIQSKVLWTVSVVGYSAPGLAILDRGNTQLLVALFSILWLNDFQNSNNSRSAIWLGLATAVKGFPIFFALSYIRIRDWRALAIFVATFTGSVLAPLAFYRSGLVENVKLISTSLTEFRAYGDWGLRYNSSLRAILLTLKEAGIGTTLVTSMLENYLLVIIAIAVALCFLALDRNSTLLHLCILGALFSCLLVDNVAQYSLSLFWLPLLVRNSNMHRKWQSVAVGGILALLLVPKGFVVGKLGDPPTGPELGPASLTSILNPLLMLMLLGILMAGSFWLHQLGAKGLNVAVHHRWLRRRSQVSGSKR